MMNQGFTTIQVSANKLVEHEIPYAAILDNNEVKAFVTDKDNWYKVEKSSSYDFSKWGANNYKPLLTMTDSLKDTMRELGWIQVGTL
jgi:hypothetical protein